MNGPFELSKEQQTRALDDIKRFFAQERDEDLGDLAAMLVLDFICETFGPHFYNLGVHDAGKFIANQVDELYSIEK